MEKIKQSKKIKNKPLSLKRNSLWNLLGSLVYALTQWGVLIAIAKLGTPEMVGIFTLSLAITAPFVLFFRFNLKSVVASDSNDDFLFSHYYTLRIISTIVFIITIIFISLLYTPDWQAIFVIIFFSLARAVESISDILHGQMQKNERLDLTAKSRIMKGILSLTIFIIVMYVTKSLVLAVCAYLLSWLLILIIYDLPNAKKFGEFSFKLNKKELKKIFFLSIPLGIAQLILSLNANIPRYYLEYFYDSNILGFFGAMIYIVTAGNNFVIALSTAVIPRLSKYYFNGKIKKYVKLISGLFVLVLGSSMVAVTCVYFYGKEILTLIYTSDYGLYKKEFYYIFILGTIMYSNKVIETGLTTTRVFRIQPYINITTLIIIISTSYFLIPIYGIMGAVSSLVMGELIQFIIGTSALIFLLKKKKEEKRY